MTAPQAEDLYASAPHLAFEFHYFNLYSKLMQHEIEGQQHITETALSQAVRYGFLLHMRALLDFFFRKEAPDDDLLAADFQVLPGFSARFDLEPWENRPAWVDEMKQHLNKRLAHITSPRWREPAPTLNYYYRRAPDINKLISHFCAALPPDLKSKVDAGVVKYQRRDRVLL